MATQKYKTSGFTIAEMLLALAVMAMLLTAVAVAFNASATNYNENKDTFNAINTARQALMRMTNELRTAEANSIPSSEAATQCSFTTAEGRISKFRFNSNSHEVYLDYIDSGGNSHSPLLCDHVSAMTWTRWPTTGMVKGVQMSMTITVGGTTKTINSAVVLRKTL
jgi:prepilin-type N-terminal cleavage/methylation domain-containing protein